MHTSLMNMMKKKGGFFFFSPLINPLTIAVQIIIIQF